MENYCVEIVDKSNVEQDFFYVEGLQDGNYVLAIAADEMAKLVIIYMWPAIFSL